MQRGFGASTMGVIAALTAAFCVVSCQKAPVHRVPDGPPAHAILLTDALGRVSLRATAWVELHASLAQGARMRGPRGPRGPYARAFDDDDEEDRTLGRTIRALARCTDERCASAAVAPEGFGTTFERALGPFATHGWNERGKIAWIGLEAAHATLGAVGPEGEALFARVATDLGVTWPDDPVAVAVVSEAPPTGRRALAPVVLATRSPCFLREADRRGAPNGLRRADRARVLDCVLVHALVEASERDDAHGGPLRAELVRALGDHDGARAWSLLVIHATAAVLTGWEPRHRSVYRRSAEAIEGPTLGWLAASWRGHEEPLTFAARYAEAWRTEHAER